MTGVQTCALPIYYDIYNQTYEFSGKDIEKEKHDLLSELSYEFAKYDLAQFFIESFSEYILVPVAITNNSTIMDNDITIKIRIDNYSAIILNPDEYPKSDCSQALAEFICSNKLIEIFFSLPTDSTVGKENVMLIEPVRFSGWDNYKYTSEDFYRSLVNNIATAKFSHDNQSIYEFKIKLLRPNETKWLNKIIVVIPLKAELQISYQILSNQSDGTLSGIVKILC